MAHVGVRPKPHTAVEPLDDTGATVSDGTYVLQVVGGVVTGLTLVSASPGALPAGGATGETLAKVSATDYDAAFIAKSVPTILLNSGDTAADVPAGTPYGTIIRFKA
jgi:hypothetical protein